MWLLVIVTVLVFAGSLVVMATITQKIGQGEDDDWRQFGNCVWFSFSTFIGESVMRLTEYLIYFYYRWVSGTRQVLTLE